MMFEREDFTSYCTLDRLPQKAGVSQARLPPLIIKELVDNALDVPAKCSFGLLDGNGFYVEDDGDGIDGTDDEIANLFSIGRPMRSSKLIRRPSRGALGNGLRVVVGAVLASGGSLSVATKGRVLKLLPQLDGSTQFERLSDYDCPGTRITVHLGSALTVRKDALCWAEEAKALAEGESRYAGKTSPHWYNVDAFHELLRAAGDRTVREIMEDQFDGCSGPKAGKIAADFKARPAKSLTRDEAEALLVRARKHARVVKPDRLGCIGKVVKGWPEGYAKHVGAFTNRSGQGNLHAQIPFIVEVYAEVAEIEAFRVFVNRTPVISEMVTFHNKDQQYVEGCGIMANYKVGRRPVRFWLNIQTPYMPITTDGKSPDLNEMRKEISAAIEKVVKRIKRAQPGGVSDKGPTMKDIILGCLDEAVNKASGNGAYRFSVRQLYYAVRPHIINALGVELDYGYFSKVITDYESEHDEIRGMYRDARGTVYHPHTGEEIQLGTIQVERYQRPKYTFNKILYCEKEGVFPILKAIKWPERNDCALMTSKGFASRAARDLLDLLGETDEELVVFCVHDADAAGTMIYQALQEGTKARPGRKVRIVNLGLEPDEATEMDLQVEDVKREGKGKRRLPVADYVEEEWKTWLQSHRVELNAMTTPEFIEWLDGKFLFNPVQKVIPPSEVLEERLAQDVRKRLDDQITEQILREGRVAERVEAEFSKRDAKFQESLKTIENDVLNHLYEKNPADQWTEPVASVADAIVGSVGVGTGAAT